MISLLVFLLSITRGDNHNIKVYCAPINAGSLGARFIILLLFVAAQYGMSALFFIPFWEKSLEARIGLYIVLVVWSILTILWFWSYIVTCWLDPGSVYAELKRHGCINSDGLPDNLPPQLESLPRCPKCMMIKPIRTHHCSDCNLCYFRFDHHCPVVGNCIALNNMKAFMLFLFYSSVMLVVLGIASVFSAIFTPIMDKSLTICIVGMVIMFAIMISCFGYQYIPEVCVNRTTLERIANVAPDTFDEGNIENFQQIFGNSKLSWLLPTKPPISGFMWSGINDAFGTGHEVQSPQIFNDYTVENDLNIPLTAENHDYTNSA